MNYKNMGMQFINILFMSILQYADYIILYKKEMSKSRTFMHAKPRE